MARSQHCERAASGHHALHEHLYATASLLFTQQSCLDHACIVKHDQVPVTHESRQVGKAMVGTRSGIAVEMKHPAGSALRGGVLGNERRRQLVVKLFYSHRVHYIDGSDCSRLPV